MHKKSIKNSILRKILPVVLSLAMVCQSAPMTAMAAQTATEIETQASTEESSGEETKPETASAEENQSAEASSTEKSTEEASTEEVTSEESRSAENPSEEASSTEESIEEASSTEESTEEASLKEESSSTELSTEEITTEESTEIENETETETESAETIKTGENTVTDVYASGVAVGKIRDITWKIDTDGHLTVTGQGDYYYADDEDTDPVPEWYQYRNAIEKATISVENMTYAGNMFKDCSGLKSVDLSNLDTSKITDMNHMFSGCRSLAFGDIIGFNSINTSKVTDMSYMFFDCDSLQGDRQEVDLSNFDTSQVTDMS